LAVTPSLLGKNNEQWNWPNTIWTTNSTSKKPSRQSR
jgi:hypothetical protein